MTENERFKSVIDFLIANRIIRNQQQFVEEIYSDKATVSQIKNGKLNIPNEMFAKIASSFPCISLDWLKDEKGEMIKAINQCNNAHNNAYSSIHQENNNNSVDIILEIQKSYKKIIDKKDEQIDKLIDIIKSSK